MQNAVFPILFEVSPETHRSSSSGDGGHRVAHETAARRPPVASISFPIQEPRRLLAGGTLRGGGFTNGKVDEAPRLVRPSESLGQLADLVRTGARIRSSTKLSGMK
jgi:hypothetical protein